MKLVFTRKAQRDLLRIRSFLEERSMTVAQNAAERIKKTTSLLLDQPRMGRPVFSPNGYRDDVREIPIRFGEQGYLLRYQIHHETIRILGIWHFRENRPSI